MSALDDAIAGELANRGRLAGSSGKQAVIVYGAGNILLHITFAALTLFASAFFVFPWIVWANTVRERRVTLEVGPDGDVIRRRRGRQVR